MLIKKISLALFSFLIFSSAFAEKPPYFILGLIEKGSLVSNSVSRDCSLYEPNILAEKIRVTVFVCEKIECFSNGIKSEFYGVSLKGDLLFTKAENVLLTDENERLLLQYKDSDWENLKRESSRYASIYFNSMKEKAYQKVNSITYNGVIVPLLKIHEIGTSTAVTLAISNQGKKTIKRAWITLLGHIYNSVKIGKPVRLELGGAILPDKESMHFFDNVWKTNVVHSVTIERLELQYTDGSKREVINPSSVWMDETDAFILRQSR